MIANPRFYGSAPFRIALLHGGPGGPGYMAPVARELAARGFGEVEPLQTADSLEGQILELRAQLSASERYVLVGSSSVMRGRVFSKSSSGNVAKPSRILQIIICKKREG